MTERQPFSTAPFRMVALIAAVILFILAALGIGHSLMAWGLAALALALLL